MKKRCTFVCVGMLCVREDGHGCDDRDWLGGHHLVASRYVDSDEAWDEARRDAFMAQYQDEETT